MLLETGIRIVKNVIGGYYNDTPKNHTPERIIPILKRPASGENVKNLHRELGKLITTLFK
ncbi:MAG: hypothetical protein ACI9Y8_001047 [Candidatus Omnitrophota bacterium]|jgi:hypothetical protein